MIEAVLLGLALVLLTRKREFLTATATIKDPNTWTDADYHSLKSKVPDVIQSIEAVMVGPPGAPPITAEQRAGAARIFVQNMLGKVWTNTYVPATNPLTTRDIEASVDSIPSTGGEGLRPQFKPAIKTIANSYFETGQVSSPAAPAPAPVASVAAPASYTAPPPISALVSTPSLTFSDQDLQTLRTKVPDAFAKLDQSIRREKPTLLNPINSIQDNVAGFIRRVHSSGGPFTAERIDSLFEGYKRDAAAAVASGRDPGPMLTSPESYDALRDIVKAHLVTDSPVAALTAGPAPAPVASIAAPAPAPTISISDGASYTGSRSLSAMVSAGPPLLSDQGIQTLRTKVPDAFAKLEQYLRTSGGMFGNSLPEDSVSVVLEEFISSMVDGVRQRGSVTPDAIDSTFREMAQRPTVAGMPPPPPADILDAVKTIVKAYYQDSSLSAAAVSSPAPSEPAVQGTFVTSISSLEKQYETLKGDYESVVDKALSTTRKDELTPLVDKVLDLNSKITSVLEQLVSALAAEEARGSTDFTAKRNDFALRLSQIKKDYGDLRSDTDQLTTLRRIRKFEESKTTTGLKGYLIAFGVAVSLLIILILFKMVQPSKNLYAANPTTASPAISPNLSM